MALSKITRSGVSELFLDSTNNRVGIGTDSPSDALHVKNDGGDATVRIQGNTRTFQIEQNNYGLRIVDVDASNAERFRINASGTIVCDMDRLSFPAGSVIQTKHVSKTDVQSISTNVPNFTSVTGLNINITPTTTTSKIFVGYSIEVGQGADLTHGYIKVQRGTTDLDKADGASNRTLAASVINTGQGGQMHTASNTFLDSPNSTSSLHYKCIFGTNNTNTNVNYINRSSRDNDAAGFDGRGISTMFVMEIAQ